MSFTTPLTQLLDIRYPIIQAPMVGVSTPELAAAVSNAGALGSIGIGASSVDAARDMIHRTQALTVAPFNVNVFCHRPAQADRKREAAWNEYLKPLFAEFLASPPDEPQAPYASFIENRPVLEMLLEERPAVVSFHFGLPPRSWTKALQEAGIVTLACATTPQEAAMVEAAGVDAIVAQGAEAGGHRGVFEPEQGDREIGLLPLTRMICADSKLPVIAAGGIMDGRGIDAVLALGAAGAQLGTAFILAPESSANPDYRLLLKSERSQHTQITRVISGRPARGIHNRMHADVDVREAPPVPDYPIAYNVGKALASAATANHCQEFSAHWAGQGAPQAVELPAAELVAQLVAESEWLRH